MKKSNWRTRPIRKSKKRSRFRLLKFFLISIISLVLIVFIAGGIGFVWLTRSLPTPQKLMERNLAESTKIFDRSGEIVLYEIFGEARRTIVDISQIPEYLTHATICAEDKKFLRHHGFNFKSMMRAVFINITSRGMVQGGSTITQQFIKNAFLTPEKSYLRKIKELIIAYQIEKKFTKEEILQMYFNEIPYGSNAYGAEEAARIYFGKSVSNLTLDEAALLAALPKAPTYYSPYGAHQDKLTLRRDYILDVMAEEAYISPVEAEEAKNIDTLAKIVPRHENIIAPHFVMYVKEMLTETYGQRFVEQGGLKVITTLDMARQIIAEEAVEKYAEANKKNFEATNASLVALDVASGQILAMVGSRDFFNTEIDGQVNVTLRPRQPGSSFKPIVYASAFQKGFTPQTIIFDVKTNFGPQGPKREDYIPENYDGNYRGPVTMKKALAGSLNICGVKTIYLAGLDKVLDLAKEMGYTTLTDKSRYGLSLVLGGGEVKLLEHVSAFSIFAREGKKILPSAILEVRDGDNRILESEDPEKIPVREVISPEICRLINGILSDNQARAFMFGEKNYLTLPDRPVAAKTGTTNDFRDAWIVGYTPDLAAGVWVGNSRNEAMKRGADGAQVAAPIWHEFMKNALKGTLAKNFNTAAEIDVDKPILRGEIPADITLKIDKASGKLATDLTPESFIEEKTFKGYHSLLHFVDKNDPRGPAPENPAQDPQYILWEQGISQWAGAQEDGLLAPPHEYDGLHIPANKPSLAILSPTSGASLAEQMLVLKLEARAPRGIKRLQCFIDEILTSDIKIDPTSDVGTFECNLNLASTEPGSHKITVIGFDDIDNSNTQEIWINTLGSFEQKIIWLAPKNGQVLWRQDFPYTLSILAPPEPIKNIKFFSQDLEENVPWLLGTIFSPETSGKFDFIWKNADSGKYKLWTEITNINNQITIGEEIEIEIK